MKKAAIFHLLIRHIRSLIRLQTECLSITHSLDHASQFLLVLVSFPYRCAAQLAAQIGVEAEKLCSAGHQLVVQVVYGGTNIKSDVSALNRGCDILIATPGRLIDHLGMAKTYLTSRHACILHVERVSVFCARQR